MINRFWFLALGVSLWRANIEVNAKNAKYRTVRDTRIKSPQSKYVRRFQYSITKRVESYELRVENLSKSRECL